MTHPDASQLLESALANLKAALESLSTPCTEECPPNCETITHDGGEPDCYGAAEEILDAQRKLTDYLNLLGNRGS